MLLIVLPIFLRMKLPWRKKWPLIVLFSLGIFTIIAAILNKIYSFTDPFGSLWTFWYTRESSTALLVANLPFVWTLWVRIPGVRKLVGKTEHGQAVYGNNSSSKNPNADNLDRANTLRSDLFGDSDEDHEMTSNAQQRHVSFADMLEERNPDSMKSKPTPLTHPQLFFGGKQSAKSELGDGESEEHVFVGEKDNVLRRESSSEPDRPTSTRDSTNHPSMNSKKSTETMV